MRMSVLWRTPEVAMTTISNRMAALSAGSGTVGKVARDLGRSSILIEIKEEYVELAKKRCRTDLKAIDEFS